ncbi:MAG TPA: hypothetical protein VNA13_05240 [Xanthomonadales bacterium]|nr:hypothetical protein [Xanthomonadales bacterium]
MLPKIGIFLIINIILTFLFSNVASATGTEIAESGGSILPLALDLANFVLIDIAMVLIYLAMREYKRAEINTALIYFLIGTLQLGLIRVFLLLVITKVFQLDDAAIVMIWHIIFYIAIFSFYIGARKLFQIANNKAANVSRKSAVYFGFISLIFSLSLIASAVQLNSVYVSTFGGFIWDNIGLQHFIAFAQAGLVSLYMFSIRKKIGPNFALIITPLLFTFALFSLIHFWELLTENWKILSLTDDFIELIESVIAFPAYIFIVIAFIRRRAVKEIAPENAITPPNPTT